MKFIKKLLKLFGRFSKKPAVCAQSTCLTDDTFSNRKAIAYFISYSGLYRAYMVSLNCDHEPDEIKEQMLAYKDLIRQKTNLFMWEHPALSRKDEFKIDNMDKEERERTFFGELSYADSEPDIYLDTFGKEEILTRYMNVYGSPSDVKERILKAEIAGDFGLASLYKKYCPVTECID